jgi:hypothetical protein
MKYLLLFFTLVLAFSLSCGRKEEIKYLSIKPDSIIKVDTNKITNSNESINELDWQKNMPLYNLNFHNNLLKYNSSYQMNKKNHEGNFSNEKIKIDLLFYWLDTLISNLNEKYNFGNAAGNNIKDNALLSAILEDLKKQRNIWLVKLEIKESVWDAIKSECHWDGVIEESTTFSLMFCKNTEGLNPALNKILKQYKPDIPTDKLFLDDNHFATAGDCLKAVYDKIF